MSFPVVLYINSADSDHLTPSLTSVATLNCTMTHETETADAFTIEVNSVANYSSVNYVYVARYDRYYWAKARSVRNGFWQFDCESDPLASFKSELLNLRGTVDRAETLYNGYVNDPNYIALAPMEYTFKEFPTGMEDNALILMTVG